MEITGRILVPLRKKINPIWWFGNDAEQTVDRAPWYMADKPQWLRWLCWQFRNPLQNTRSFGYGYSLVGAIAIAAAIVSIFGLSWWWLLMATPFTGGVQDRNYIVTGRDPVMTVQRNDLTPPETGWQWCILWLTIPLPFVSYSGKNAVWYVGWQPTGFFGAKLNRMATVYAGASVCALAGAVIVLR